MRFRHFLLALALLGIIFSPLANSASAASPNSPATKVNATNDADQQLSEQEIQNRLSNIGKKYKVGEKLSTEDANFIKIYAYSHQIAPFAQSLAKSKGFSRTVKKGGRTVHVSGSLTMSLGAVSNRFGGHYTTKITKGKSARIKNSVTIDVYGALGSSGWIGKVYHGSVSHTNPNGKTNTLNNYKHFTAVSLYGYIQASVTISYKSGSFTIN